MFIAQQVAKALGGYRDDKAIWVWGGLGAVYGGDIHDGRWGQDQGRDAVMVVHYEGAM